MHRPLHTSMGPTTKAQSGLRLGSVHPDRGGVSPHSRLQRSATLGGLPFRVKLQLSAKAQSHGAEPQRERERIVLGRRWYCPFCNGPENQCPLQIRAEIHCFMASNGVLPGNPLFLLSKEGERENERELLGFTGGGEPSEQGAGATGLQLLCISLHFQMASGSRLRRGGSSSNVGRSSGFRPRSPHFCKVVVAESLRRGKIEIPLKFVRKYGHDLLNQVVLKVPGNDEWLVAVEQAHGKLWLGEGWREFQDHYCLIQGSFLLFQLDNLIGFHVLIFDRTATEIDYPARNPRGSICKNFMSSAKIKTGLPPVELGHEGKSWPVKMLCYPEERQGRLCRGWAAFLDSNAVRAGDVCFFELLKRNVFYVHIFRCSAH
ncbi:hypothetical protein CRG98_020868 [Punica granatum]|uniref:TF-B3 domain-containing protein n=1 Tax=Punica granatum TaxID=22663 RepID=A0A2I0JQZ6_PUNGR|nr:hypothetical protein CRG98_020868 [Punica granatum]